jgi:hypothetical protein
VVLLGKKQKRSGPTPDKIQSASKAQERTILENARHLAENPEKAVPSCKDGCVWFSPVKKARKQVRKVAGLRGDEDALEDAAKKGGYLSRGYNAYARAYAVLLLVEAREEIPYVAPAKLPWGSSYFANWGDAPQNVHLGIQHWDDRQTRLLAVKDWVDDRGLHLYATGDELVCSGKSPDPPEAFVDEKLDALGVAGGSGSTRDCPHGGPGDEAGGLAVTWKSVDVTARLCHRCLHEGNTVHGIIQHLAAPKPWTDFDVDVVLPPLETAGPDVVAPETPAPPGELTDKYLKGALTDDQLVSAARQHRRDALSRRDELILAAGGVVYGDHREAFLDALEPGPAERAALEAALEEHDAPLILDRDTPGEALEKLWHEHGLACLETVTGEQEIAQRLHGEELSAGDNLSALLRRAAKEADRADLASALPSYDDLPPALAFADEAARAYRLDGRDGVMQVVKNRTPGDGNARAVSWALCLELDAASGREWKYGDTEMELGEALQEPVAKLLEAEPEDYHDVLERIARTAGIRGLGSPSSGPGS